MNEKELVLELKRLHKFLKELEDKSMQKDISCIEGMELDISMGMIHDAIELYGKDLYKIMY